MWVHVYNRYWPRLCRKAPWIRSENELNSILEPRQTQMKLMDGFDSNYRYILVAARRARQLQGGAPPVIDTHSRKPCRIAQDEIKAGKVKWVIPEAPASAVEVASEILDKVPLKD